MTFDEELRELHNLGIIAAGIFNKTTEPRTSLRLLPNGKAVVTFYSTCFSFIPKNTNQITFESVQLHDFVEKARNEVDLYQSIRSHPNAVVSKFKAKADVIPFVICVNGTNRIYYFHLCKDHRKDRLTYKPSCSCYITFEDL